VYTAQFAEGASISDKAVLGGILAGLNVDPASTLARIEQPEIKQRLRQQTEVAQELGIFGAPSFLAKDELYWGDDRLEQAMARLTAQ
jgi:2-hydroxychromene-2-carboxylate isomerase